DLDYKKVRSIIAEELAKIPKQKFPEFPKLPSNKGIDVALSLLEEIKKSIGDLPEPKEVDFTELKDLIDNKLASFSEELSTTINSNVDLVGENSGKSYELKIEEMRNSLLEEVKKLFEETMQQGVLMKMPAPEPKKKKYNL
ncbi:MAG: hypothetical protein WC243_03865, partial [Patescibacteria group bacterium]